MTLDDVGAKLGFICERDRRIDKRALITPFLLALVFLSFMLLQESPRSSISLDGQEILAPTLASEHLLHYADWRQANESYLAYQPGLK